MKKGIIKILVIPVVYLIIAFILIGITFKSFAFTTKTVEVSKTVFCMDVVAIALYGYDLKQENKKLIEFQDSNLIFKKLLNDSLKIGYKANSIKEAADNSFKNCIESKIWAH